MPRFGGAAAFRKNAKELLPDRRDAADKPMFAFMRRWFAAG
jgi:hypothetical protein